MSLHKGEHQLHGIAGTILYGTSEYIWCYFVGHQPGKLIAVIRQSAHHEVPTERTVIRFVGSNDLAQLCAHELRLSAVTPAR